MTIADDLMMISAGLTIKISGPVIMQSGSQMLGATRQTAAFSGLSNRVVSGRNTVEFVAIQLFSISKLDLSFNDYWGPLPQAISNFHSLTYLDVSTNNFSGPIPGSIGELPKLEYLNASVCQFSGAIPSQLGNLSELTTLFLSWNFFSPESLPPSSSNLTKLQIFSCASCPLSRTIPTWLEKLKQLNFLELSYNNLSGNIPTELMHFPKL
eukprot:Gb_00191 [translate_table: standard]